MNSVIGFLAPYEWRPAITLVCFSAVTLYMRGLVRGARPGFARAAAFMLGVAAMYFVTQTRYDYFSQFLFFAHRGQHLVLHHAAPMLIVLARPLEVLARGTPSRLRSHAAGAWRSAVVQSGYRAVQQPVVAGTLFVGLIYLWLIPAVHFDVMLSASLYNVMSWSMAVDGILFWWLVLNPNPSVVGYSLGHGKRCLLLALITFPQIILGAYISLAETGLYDIYEVCGRPWPIDPGTDQTLGGLITWIPPSMMSALAVVIVLAQWSRQERLGTTALRPIPEPIDWRQL